MLKLLKYTVGTIVAVVIIFVIAGVVLKSYINPQMLEARIVSEVHDRTGRDLIIKDGLKIDFFPSLSFEIQQASLGNPANFGDNTPFVDIGNLTFTIELLPLLFEKRILLNEIILNDSTFNLITLANGQTNWKDFSSQTLSKSAKPIKTSAQDTPEKKPVNFDVGQLVINNSTLNWIDHQKNKQWQVTELNVDSSDIAFGQAFPLKMNGKYSQPNEAASTWSIDSKINIDPDKQIYILKPFALKANLKGTQPVTLTLSELEFSEAEQLIALKDGVFSGAQINGKGNLNISSYKKNPQAKGQFTFDALELGNFKTTNVSVPISSQNAVYVASPITSKLYGGSFTGDLTLNNSSNVPQWNLKYQLANINLQSLINDMGSNSNKFTGIMQSNGQLSAVGLNADSIKASLSGPAHFKIDNGIYNGIDLTYWWQVGKALMEAAATAAIPTVNVITDIANVVNLAQFKNTNQTTFTDITGDFTFKNGVGTTNNLILFNDVIYVKAEGQIDINKKYVDLKLYISQSTGLLAKGTPIPFTLKGNFGNLQIKPDVAAFPSSVGGAAAAVTKGAASLSKKAPDALKQPIQQLGNALGGLLNKK